MSQGTGLCAGPTRTRQRRGRPAAEIEISFLIPDVTNFTTCSSVATDGTFSLDLSPPLGYPSNRQNPVFTTLSSQLGG